MPKDLTTQDLAEIGELLEEVQEQGIKIGSKGWTSEHSVAFGKLGGRPAIKYDNLELEITTYIRDYEKLGDVVPSLSGLCVYLGINIDTLRNVVQRMPDSERFFRILKSIKELRRHMLTNKALKGETKERFTMFLLNVEHDMIEKKEVKNTHEGTINIKQALNGAKEGLDKSNAIDIEPVDDF